MTGSSHAQIEGVNATVLGTEIDSAVDNGRRRMHGLFCQGTPKPATIGRGERYDSAAIGAAVDDTIGDGGAGLDDLSTKVG